MEPPESIRVLVVEDEPDMATVLKTLLGRKLSPAVEIAENCASAREKFKSQTFDIITLDHQLPDGDGLELLGEINEMDSPPQVIIITGHGDEQTAVKSFKLGANDYVVKGKDFSRLFPEAVERALLELKLRCAEERQEELLHHLGERVKELDCLYGLSTIVERPGVSLEEIFKETVELIPPAWQYPDITCAKLAIVDEEFTTDNYRETDWTRSADIIVGGEKEGTLQVCYLEELPQAEEGPFLAEERNLIDALAKQLGRVIERMRGEQQLVAAKEMWERSFKDVGEGMFIIDKDFTVLQCNEAFANLAGDKPDNLIGHKCYELVHNLDGPPDFCVTNAAVIKGQGGRAELYEPSLGKYLEVSTDPFFDPEDNFDYAIHLVRDVTERKRAEEALKESGKKYRLLIESMNEGIWMIDKDARTTFANDRIAEMLGYTVQEMMWKPLYSFMDEEGAKRAETLFERRREGVSEQHDFEFLKKDGAKLYVTLETSPVTDDDGNFIGAIAGVIDITERKRAEDEITRLTRRVIEEHEETRLKISADLHGELCQTLSAFKIELDTLNKEAGDRLEDQKDRLEGMRALVEDTIDTMRSIAGELTPALLDDFGLGKELEQYIEEFSERTGIAANLECAGLPFELPKDLELPIFRIAQEALVNVQRHANAREVKVSLTHENEQLTLSIEDDGEGFDVEKALIGDAPSAHFGILGMRERARMVGGELEILSNMRGGTTLVVRVPL